MKLSLETTQVSPEFWLATLRVEEPGKVPLTRDFVVTEQQLAFLNVLARSFS